MKLFLTLFLFGLTFFSQSRAFAADSFEVTYHTWPEVQAILKTISQNNPTLAQYFEYGVSTDGYTLMGLKISDHVTDDEVEPELLFTAATHGDESITVEILLGLIKRLEEGYASDSRIRSLVDNHELFFIPVVNPGGFVKSFRLEDGVDPNRSYPGPLEQDKVPTPSIAALIDLFESRDFKGSIDFHAGTWTPMVMYPWAYTSVPVEEDYKTEFYDLAQSMTERNHFASGPISGLVGLVTGSSADYYFWRKQSLSLGIEVGPQRYPQISEIPRYIDEQTESTWRFIEHF